MLSNIITGRKKRPRRVLLYGPHGIGKSTWAGGSGGVCIPTEDGLEDIGIARFPVARKLGDVMNALSSLSSGDHGYRSVIIDTLDWLERLIWAAVADQEGKSSIESIPYGKGYILALREWEAVLDSLDNLRNARGMNVILLAHAKIAQFRAPDADTYDRYEPDLHKSASPMVQEWCDEVLFATWTIRTVEKEERGGRKRARAVGGEVKDRIVWTTERATHVAKRRIPLPDTMPLEWAAYREAVRHVYGLNGEPAPTPQPAPASEPAPVPEQPAAGNIGGIVTEGSSKPRTAHELMEEVFNG